MGIVCRSCKAPVLYARNIVTGNMMILNALVDQGRGNVEVDVTGAEPRCRVLDQDARAAARDAGSALYLSHHATCPEGPAWRRKKKKSRST